MTEQKPKGGDSSSEECISPIMSQETYQELFYSTILPDLLGTVSSECGQVHGTSLDHEVELPSGDKTITAEEQGFNNAKMPDTTFTMIQTPNNNEPMEPKNFLDFKGDHGFDICFQGNDQPTKSAQWTYSKIVDKLFVSFNLACPVHFNFDIEPPFGSVIRATPYFKEPVDMHRPVVRCIRHQAGNEPTNQGFEFPEHILRCDALGALYDKNSGHRLSVVVPYRESRSAISIYTLNYYFTCFSSCVGGMNRRPIVVVFTLEHGNIILAQKVIEVRICACPGRDRMKCESKFYKKQPKSLPSGNNNAEESKDSKRSHLDDDIKISSRKMPPPKKIKVEEEDDMYQVSINFEVQGKLKASIYQRVLNSIKRSVTNSQ